MKKKLISYFYSDPIFYSLGIFLIFLGTWFYLSHFSFRHFLLGWEEAIPIHPVGEFQKTEGMVRQKNFQSIQFYPTSKNKTIFNLDTIFTGPQGSATIVFKDGGSLELAQNTLIQIKFLPVLTFQGIDRTELIKIVRGRVRGHAKKKRLIFKTKEKTIFIKKGTISSIKVKKKKVALLIPLAPTLPPSSISTTPPPHVKINLRLISPLPKKKFSLPPHTTQLMLPIQFRWTLTPFQNPITFSLTYKEKGQEKILFQKNFKLSSPQGAISVSIKKPGFYQWKVKVWSYKKEKIKAKQKKIKAVEKIDNTESEEKKEKKQKITIEEKTSTFYLKKAFDGLQLLDPLVAGSSIRTNTFQGKTLKNFNITFRWKPFPKVQFYKILFYKHLRDSKPAFIKKTKHHFLEINKRKVFSGKVYYQVIGFFKNQFQALSKKSFFKFAFLPPIPVGPRSNERFTKIKLLAKEHRILFTWRTTIFTQFYLFEISKSFSFKTILIRKKLTKNFLLLPAPAPGTYYWRIRSFSKKIASRPSPPRAFHVLR